MQEQNIQYSIQTVKQTLAAFTKGNKDLKFKFNVIVIIKNHLCVMLKREGKQNRERSSQSKKYIQTEIYILSL